MFSHIFIEEVNALNRAFSDAMHKTASRFARFEHAVWNKFVHLLAPNWKTPSSNKINTDLLDETYKEDMDGATNVPSRSMFNIVAHTILP